MKKLLLVLVLLIAGVTAKSQLVTYEITATGYSNGLIIPNPFYIDVTAFDLVQRNGELFYQVPIETISDTIKHTVVLNDSISGMAVFPVTLNQLKTYTQFVLFNNTVKSRLEDIYGASNVKIKN